MNLAARVAEKPMPLKVDDGESRGVDYNAGRYGLARNWALDCDDAHGPARDSMGLYLSPSSNGFKGSTWWTNGEAA